MTEPKEQRTSSAERRK